VLSHHAGSLNIQGQIYLMPDCTTELDTVTVNNAFEHAHYYLEIIFWRDQDARVHMHIQDQNG